MFYGLEKWCKEYPDRTPCKSDDFRPRGAAFTLTPPTRGCAGRCSPPPRGANARMGPRAPGADAGSGGWGFGTALLGCDTGGCFWCTAALVGPPRASSTLRLVRRLPRLATASYGKAPPARRGATPCAASPSTRAHDAGRPREPRHPSEMAFSASAALVSPPRTARGDPGTRGGPSPAALVHAPDTCLNSHANGRSVPCKAVRTHIVPVLVSAPQ